MTISSVLIMPYFNQRKYVRISDGRYLMPLLLVAYALLPLSRYYGQEIAAGRTNAPLLRAVDAVSAARRPDEPVLLDRDLADVKLEGGGTAFRSLRFLLTGVGIDDRSVDSVSDYARKMNPGNSALLVTDARGFESQAKELERLGPAGIQSRVVVSPPDRDGYGAYRL